VSEASASARGKISCHGLIPALAYGGIWASQPNMDLPIDEPGVYRVALEVVCNQEKQEVADKLAASILAGKVSLHQPVLALTHNTDPSSY
jgi:hypothetical protein